MYCSETRLARTAPASILIRGLLHPAAGPLVRVVLHGDGVKQSGLAVLDTGASMSAIDTATANALGCPVTGVATWAAVQAREGENTSEMRQVALQVHGDNRRFAFDLIAIQGLQHAVEGYPVVVLLGWDFLGRCRLSCDGPAGTFALELPKTPRTVRRRT